jgi:GPH family glycoside/pentoside/hexuronide:cation symporter
MRTTAILAYGALGFPLAFAALPLYVHLPRLYAESVGLSLGLVGAVLLAARLGDALIDPWLGQWSDRRFGAGGRRTLIAGALPLLALGLLLLLSPPAGAGVPWLLGGLLLTFLGFSLASINYHAWGAEVGADANERTRVTAAREGFSLAGVVVAAALPMVLLQAAPGTPAGEFATAMRQTAWVFLPLLAIAALVTLLGAPRPAGTVAMTAAPVLATLRDPVFVRLLVILLVGGIAAGIPATLVLFYIADVLQLGEWQGVFLALYFVSGALALPAWVAYARRRGKVSAWSAAMMLAIASFVWAFTLGPGDGLAFALICIATGAALGAELAVPPALLADRLARQRGAGDAVLPAGGHFGVWNFVTKLNLALAAGISLPLIGLAGYQVGPAGSASAQGLLALTAVYALLPAVIKLLALVLLRRWGPFLEPELPETSR